MIKPLDLDAQGQAQLQSASDALDAARAAGQPYAICDGLRQLARRQAHALLLIDAEHHLLQALRWAHAGLGTDLQVDILCDLCDLTDLWAQAEDQLPQSDGDTVRERLRGYAIQVCERAPDMSERSAEARVLLRLGDMLGRCGDDELQQLLLQRARHLLANERPRQLAA